MVLLFLSPNSIKAEQLLKSGSAFSNLYQIEVVNYEVQLIEDPF
ncbi:hypothetical protein V7168_22800 [Neobacillus drentensis]